MCVCVQVGEDAVGGGLDVELGDDEDADGVPDGGRDAEELFNDQVWHGLNLRNLKLSKTATAAVREVLWSRCDLLREVYRYYSGFSVDDALDSMDLKEFIAVVSRTGVVRREKSGGGRSNKKAAGGD